MEQLTWKQTFICLVAGVLVLFGVLYLIWPEAMAEASGVLLGSPLAVVEYRAYYGGLQLGLGLCLLLFIVQKVPMSVLLTLVVACFGVVLLVRVASIVTVGAVDGFHATALVLEACVVIVGVLGLRHTEHAC